MLKIYGRTTSSNVQKVLWCCGEIGLDFERIDIDAAFGGLKTPGYFALNPNGLMPTIDDDGFILSESMAINFYLAKKHNSPLFPKDPKHEALVLQWSLWETDRLDRQIVNYCRHTKDLPEAERKPEVAKASWEEMVPAFDALEAALKKSEWLAGPAFSVGDLNVAAALFRALTLDLAKWPKLNAWLRRCWERPAAKKAKAMREA